MPDIIETRVFKAPNLLYADVMHEMMFTRKRLGYCSAYIGPENCTIYKWEHDRQLLLVRTITFACKTFSQTEIFRERRHIKVENKMVFVDDPELINTNKGKSGVEVLELCKSKSKKLYGANVFNQ